MVVEVRGDRRYLVKLEIQSPGYFREAQRDGWMGAKGGTANPWGMADAGKPHLPCA